jgi:hypothetical protein
MRHWNLTKRAFLLHLVYYTNIFYLVSAVKISVWIVALSTLVWGYNPEDSHLHNHRRQNLKSYLVSTNRQLRTSPERSTVVLNWPPFTIWVAYVDIYLYAPIRLRRWCLSLLRWVDTVSVELRPLTGPFSIPHTRHESIWSSGRVWLTGKIESIGEKTCPSATLSTTNTTRGDPGAKLGLGGDPACLHTKTATSCKGG